MKFKAQTSGGTDIPPVEADEIGDHENMFVLRLDGKTVAMFSKSFVQFIVPADDSE